MTPAPQTSTLFPPCSDIGIAPALRREIVLRDIDVFLDVGANVGQFATWLRTQIGFERRIISLEPITTHFEALSRAAALDHAWEAYQFAVGSCDAEGQFGVAGDSISTSLFTPTPETLRLFPDTAQRSTENACVRTLDTLWPTFRCDGARVYLKVDVEGAELAVLQGASSVLDKIAFIEAELSLTPNYVGAPLFDEVVAFVLERGFTILAIEANHGDDVRTGQMLMVDTIFARPSDSGYV